MAPKKEPKKGKGRIEYDEKLFQALRALRKEMADEQQVPPFVIFGDATLVEMAAYRPVDAESLLRINGVGQHKLGKYGTRFLEAIRSSGADGGTPLPVPEQEKPQPPVKAKEKQGLSETEQKTFILCQQGLGLDQICRTRNLTAATVCRHVEKAMNAGMEIDIYRLLPSGTVTLIAERLAALGGNALLTEVKNGLPDNVDYAEIRLVRAYLQPR